MSGISFKRHGFPAAVIPQAVYLYFRFTLSTSREAVRCWVQIFGLLIAASLRKSRLPPTGRWHLDEMMVEISGQHVHICARLTTKAKFSTWSFRSGATQARR